MCAWLGDAKARTGDAEAHAEVAVLIGVDLRGEPTDWAHRRKRKQASTRTQTHKTANPANKHTHKQTHTHEQTNTNHAV